jgi:hypothetical protein
VYLKSKIKNQFIKAYLFLAFKKRGKFKMLNRKQAILFGADFGPSGFPGAASSRYGAINKYSSPKTKCLSKLKN